MLVLRWRCRGRFEEVVAAAVRRAGTPPPPATAESSSVALGEGPVEQDELGLALTA
ncbi:hypothetical protein [Streptomyces californicus]|uniref:hypothetical protein n=1 Tax=Streptomyces californicus TaxID=67351 RepID=UPI00378AF159